MFGSSLGDQDPSPKPYHSHQVGPIGNHWTGIPVLLAIG